MDTILLTIEQIARRNLDTVVTAMNYSREAVYNAHVARSAGDDTAYAEWQKTAKQWFDAAEMAAKDHDALVAAIKTVSGLATQ